MIKPYYQDSYVKIYHGDCREILPTLEKVDLVYADPPFNTQDGMGPSNRNYEDRHLSSDRLSEDEYQIFCEDWFNKVSTLTERILITPGCKNVGRYGNPLWVVAISKPSAPSYNKFGGFNCWEPLLCFAKPKKRLTRDVVVYDSQCFKRGYERKHPCPDNENMVAWIIDLWSVSNDIILDPFLGSGTTAYCAKKLNRKCIGIEIEEKYCEIAAKRCSQSVMELKI